MTMASSLTDPMDEVVQHLRSLSEIPNLAMLSIESRNDEELHNNLFSEGVWRIELLKILFIELDDKVESTLKNKNEIEVLDALQNLCVAYGFINNENCGYSKSFIIGKMSPEKQCPIWERIIKSVKSIMNYGNVVNEVENAITKVDLFFRNPLLKEFLSLVPSVTSQSQISASMSESYIETIDCDLRNTKLKLENYKKLECKITSPENEERSHDFIQPPTLSQEELLASIKKWEIGFKDHLEPQLRITSPDKENENEINHLKLSESIKSLRSCCSKVSKNLENRRLIEELTYRIKDHNKTDEEESQS